MTKRHPPTAKSAGLKALSAALAVLMVLAVAAPAYADEWRDHEGHARDWHRGHPHPVYDVYAPPAVVYAPPPPSPGISLILPINIR